MRKKIIIAALQVFLCYVPLNACTCIGERSITYDFNTSSKVFCGQIISKKLIVYNVDSTFSIRKNEFKVKILIKYKGRFRKKYLKILTGLGGGDCGYDFILNKKYIIYAQIENNYCSLCNKVAKYLSTDACTRTREFIESENAELKKLRKAKSSKWF